MGKGTDSFKRELGKNTGKWVSNKVFGDGHSTPHRVSVKVQKQQLENDLRKTELKAEKQKRRSENRKELFSKGKDFLSDIDGNKDEILSTNSKRDEIIATSIPSEKEEVMDFANFLLSTIKSNGWKSGENEKHINSLSDACLTKLEQCEIKLKSVNDLNGASYIESEIKKLKKKKMMQKYLIFAAIAFFALVMFILFQLGILKD